MNYEFLSTDECRLYAAELAASFHCHIVYQYYIDKHTKVSLKEENSKYLEYRFGLTPTSKKRVLGEVPFSLRLEFYAKKKGIRLLYVFILEKDEEPLKKAVITKTQLFVYLKHLTKETNQGIVSLDVVHQESKRKYELSSLEQLKDTLFEVRSTDLIRADKRHEVNVYLPNEGYYLNVHLRPFGKE